MELVFLYGPPAAGKLTVGKELAQLTGFTLFHNHQSIDWARDILEFDTPAFWRTVLSLRMTALDEMVRERMDLITTFVYLAGSDLTPIDQLCNKVKEAGGRASFVWLSCGLDTLEERIGAEDRVAIRKLASVRALRTYLETHDVWQALPDRESLHLDTTKTPPEETALRIVQHLGLPLGPTSQD